MKNKSIPLNFSITFIAFCISNCFAVFKATIITSLLSINTAAFAADQTQNNTRLRITGSSTLAPLILELSENYTKRHQKVRIDVEGGGSSRGIADAKTKKAQLGMVSRARKASDTSDLTFEEIAKDGVAVIVHSSNPLADLSKQTLIDVFSGVKTNWKELGGKDALITVISKAEGRSTLEVFSDYTGLTAQQIKAKILVGENQQAIKSIESIPLGIAYVSAGEAFSSKAKGAKINLVSLEGIEPNAANIAVGRYALTRSLNIVYTGKLDQASSDFLKFIKSPESRKTFEGLSFVPTSF